MDSINSPGLFLEGNQSRVYGNSQKKRISVRSGKREKKAFKHCIRKKKAMTWKHLEAREAFKRSDWRTDGREERKRKAAYHELWTKNDGETEFLEPALGQIMIQASWWFGNNWTLFKWTIWEF